MENLGLRIWLASPGDVKTTWYSNDGKGPFHGNLNPRFRLYDEGGTEIPGNLQRRYGMDSNLKDFQPGYGSHSDAQAQLASMVQRAIEDGYFKKYGILPGTIVNGQTIRDNFNPEFIHDVAYLFCGDRDRSEIVRKYADRQPVPVDVTPEVAKSLDGFFAKKHKNHPERFSPFAWTPGDMLAAGVDLSTVEGRMVYYQYLAQRLKNQAGKDGLSAASNPSDPAYTFVTVDVESFLYLMGQLK